MSGYFYIVISSTYGSNHWGIAIFITIWVGLISYFLTCIGGVISLIPLISIRSGSFYLDGKSGSRRILTIFHLSGAQVAIGLDSGILGHGNLRTLAGLIIATRAAYLHIVVEGSLISRSRGIRILYSRSAGLGSYHCTCLSHIRSLIPSIGIVRCTFHLNCQSGGRSPLTVLHFGFWKVILYCSRFIDHYLSFIRGEFFCTILLVSHSYIVIECTRFTYIRGIFITPSSVYLLPYSHRGSCLIPLIYRATSALLHIYFELAYRSRTLTVGSIIISR